MSETPHVPPSYTPPPGGSFNPPPPPPGGSAAGGDKTVMLVLSYLGLLALIPLLTKKDDPEVQWHAKNGLALGLVWIALWIVFMVLGFAMRGVLAGLGCGLGVVQCILGLGLLVVDIIAMVKAIGGKRYRIPMVTDLAEKM